MDIWCLDSSYNTIGIVDAYESLIWVERYNDVGDFELYLPTNEKAIALLTQKTYLYRQDSDRYMIIETIETDINVEQGSRMTITGRSLESILDRRVIWGQEVADEENLQNYIQRLLDKNIINPADTRRKIPNFVFKTSTDERITSLTISIQFLGENLLAAITALCQAFQLGFRVLPYGDGGFSFELYMGADRTDDQTINLPIIFSPSFDNLLSSNYFSSLRAYKTAALVGGEGEGSERKLAEALSEDGGGVGLDRREMFADARGVSTTTDDGELTDAQYTEQLIEAGKEAISETATTTAFEGAIDATRQFVYNRDFFLGDIVQVRNEHDMEAKSRVSELVRSQSSTDISVIPTFIAV